VLHSSLCLFNLKLSGAHVAQKSELTCSRKLAEEEGAGKCNGIIATSLAIGCHCRDRNKVTVHVYIYLYMYLWLYNLFTTFIYIIFISSRY